MNKKLLSALSLACVVGTLVACGETGGSKNVTIGAGTVATLTANQLDLDFATAIYEGDKVVASLIDVLQIPLTTGKTVDTSKDFVTTDDVQTKRDRHDGYGMKVPNGPSQIGEWYEQAEKFEKWTEGKTTNAISSNVEVDENNHATNVSGCTMTVDMFQATVTEAKTNAKAASVNAGTYKFGIGHNVDLAFTSDVLTQVNVTVAGVLWDSEDKVVTTYIDEIQIPLTWSEEGVPSLTTVGKTQVNYKGQTVASKKELGDDYGMKVPNGPSQIGEWYEQAEKFEKWTEGKTTNAISSNVEVDENNHATNVSGCTMTVDTYQAAIVDSLGQYNFKSINI